MERAPCWLCRRDAVLTTNLGVLRIFLDRAWVNPGFGLTIKERSEVLGPYQGSEVDDFVHPPTG